MFFEFNNELFNKDSSLAVVFGARYVDPNFRSAGAQTRRIDFNDNLTNTIYPNYSNDMTTRSVSMFDVISDENIYNQDLSGTLMNFNPLFSNVNPYGNATTNRKSAYLSMELENNLLEASVNSSFSNEVIGQGTVEKRQFFKITSSLKLNIIELLSSEKEISFFEFLSRNFFCFKTPNLSKFKIKILLVFNIFLPSFRYSPLVNILSI